jgi:hypothetical protein
VDAHVAAAQTEDAPVVTADVASAPAVPTKPLTASPAVKAPLSPARPSTPADAHSTVAAASIDLVTISGCLDFDGKSTWLKDTSGVDAPRTRSWRSGFLRKRSPRIALVDGPTSAETYDGRLVSVTGVLVDREMRVSSLKPIAGDCE